MCIGALISDQPIHRGFEVRNTALVRPRRGLSCERIPRSIPARRAALHARRRQPFAIVGGITLIWGVAFLRSFP